MRVSLQSKDTLFSVSSIVFPLIVLAISYCTIFHKYEKPAAFYWDENYHIAAAQKYLNEVFFMELHPPLGKLLIAAGEYLFSSNSENDQFLQTEHAPSSPPNFSFAGYRFFPVLLATFCPLLLFLTVRSFTGPLFSLFVSMLFALDNALIVHLRGAMLEGIQLFFMLLFLYILSILLKSLDSGESIHELKRSWLAMLAGLSAGAVLTTKLNGIVLLALLLPYFVALGKRDLRQLGWVLVNLSAGFIVVFYLVWSIHFSLGKKIEPKLPDSGYFRTSASYRLSLDKDAGNSINFLTKVYDHTAFTFYHSKGVPELNFCKNEENGSPWYWWPFGGKSISYRWDKKDGLTSFLYLVVNPVGWGLSLLGILLSGLVFCSYLLFKPVIPNFNAILSSSLLACWILYMTIIGGLGRVMYLYHYFIPLVLGWIMLALIVPELTHFGSFRLTNLRKQGILALVSIMQIVSFLFFSPFTYAKGISDDDIKTRNWLKIWNIHCTDCPSTNPVARAIEEPKKIVASDISISGLPATTATQDWGIPTMNKSVIKEAILVKGVPYASAIGVHSESRLVFATAGNFSKFSAGVALPDYLIAKNQGSVFFRVLGDNKELWKSSKITPGIAAVSFNLDISNIKVLTLELHDVGDGITDDHGVWLEPKFE